MRKKYFKPTMIVEDFSMNQTIASNSKCTFDVNNLFTDTMTLESSVCKAAFDESLKDNQIGEVFRVICSAYQGNIDVDNADNDNDYSSGVDNVHPFTQAYHAKGSGDTCRDYLQYENKTFLDYAHDPKSWHTDYPISACSPSSGVNPLQNS